MADDEADVNDAAGSADLSWAQCPHCKEFVQTGDPHKPDCFVFVDKDPSIFADTFEAYRQQGREEVLREIANVFPNEFSVQATNDEGRCVFCLSYPTHTTNCLWVRCQGVK